MGLLRDAEFRKLYASVLINAVGNQVSRLVLPLVAVILLGADELEIGVLTASTEVALLVIGLPAGAWIDQVRRRKVLITAEMVRGLVLITIPVAWWLRLLTIEQLFAVAFLIGACSAFYEGASQSYLPSLVGRANLVEANARIEGIRQVLGVVGPAGGGQLAAVLGAPIALLATVGGTTASSALIARIRKVEPRRKGTDFTVASADYSVP